MMLLCERALSGGNGVAVTFSLSVHSADHIMFRVPLLSMPTLPSSPSLISRRHHRRLGFVSIVPQPGGEIGLVITGTDADGIQALISQLHAFDIWLFSWNTSKYYLVIHKLSLARMGLDRTAAILKVGIRTVVYNRTAQILIIVLHVAD